MSFDTAGCLTGFFRRLLCSGSLPTHPSDQITEPSDEICKEKRTLEIPDSPGIVARLMGLDSLPDLNSISRSRSMNSADYSTECSRIERQHRRVKTSISFREIPIFFEEENEEFISLCFESGNEVEELNSATGSKCGKENRVEMEKISSGGGKLSKKMKKEIEKMESDSTSEDSSPVSVLDFTHFLTDPQIPKSDLESKSRRKLSSELENFKYPFRRNDNILISEVQNSERNGGKCVGSRTKYDHHPSKKYREIWDETLRLTESEIVNSSNWVFRERIKFQDFEDLDAHFGIQILDQLLDELVDQFAYFP